ncbi:GNAT family N-acetyltransferase [Croceicoccus sp. Ery5]|uniref:GNAT family N-acetyltransferase n=1 Tax=Croceicoccus sp. Ery5 TaxID=1703340 RepID=UPI001E3D68B8|nr:GNAT family N-acetyltransferase [Croceicoccus sp. Ery5]
MDDLEITRHDEDTRGEYRARPADSDAIGRLTYQKRGDVLVADHTLVPPEIGGRGIAGRLVDALIADARSEGFRIVPQCSYVEAAFRRHPEWSDLRA